MSADVSGFGVTPTELETVDGALAGAASCARAAVQRLRDEGAALLAEGWRGGAAAAFRDGWTEWLVGTALVLEALDELAGLVGSAGRSYAAGDDAVRATVAGRPA